MIAERSETAYTRGMLLPLLLAITPAVPQTTWYVDANAAGPGTGTTVDPYSRIDYAVAQAATVSGDTILIEPGDYVDEDIEVLGKGLRLQANGAPGSVTISGPGGLSQIGSGSSSLIRIVGQANGPTELVGLNFMGGVGEDDGSLVRGGAAFFSDATVVMTDCSLEGKANIGGALYLEDSDYTAVNSALRGKGGPDDYLQGGQMTVGGAIHAVRGSVVLNDCEVLGAARNPYPHGRVYGESTSFSDCTAVTITRGSIRPDGNEGSYYYTVGGRIYARNTSLQVDDTILANSGGSSRGTGIAAAKSDVHVTGVTFDMGQQYRIQGDGMHLSSCTTLVDDCTFTNCGGSVEGDSGGTDYQYFGGAIYSSGPEPCTVLNSRFVENHGSRGGAIYAQNGIIENCDFDGNTAYGAYQQSGRGGAVWLGSGSIRRCTFSGNIASGNWGGGSSAEFGTVGFGGAVYANSGLIEQCQFNGNQLNHQITPNASNTPVNAKLHGGAVYASGAITIRDSSIDASSIVPRMTAFSGAQSQDLVGCGVYLANGGTIDGCSFRNNGIGSGTHFEGTRWFGGGLFVEAGATTITSSTFEGNEAERGGAIYNEGGELHISLSVLLSNRLEELAESTRTAERPAIAGDATIERCTIAGHAAVPTSAAGEVLMDGGSVDSSIIFGNRGLALPAALPVSYSIVEGGHTGFGNLNADPLFIEAPDDVRLWPASPAIDAGNPSLVDEGTSSRADMGALPYDPSDCGTMCADPLGAVMCTSNPNSTGLTGQTQAFGSSVAADEFLLLSATQLPLVAAGYFVTSDTMGFVPNFGGSDGNLCLGSPLYRLSDEVLNSGTTGRVGRAIDTQSLPQGQVIAAGSTWTFQFWHRDLASTTAASNTTSAVTVTFL